MQTLAVALTEGEKEAAVAGGVAGATFGIIATIGIIFFVLYVIASWKIFQKAGEPGWKALIPIYNVYIMFKIVNMKSWFWWLIAMSICCNIMIAVDIPGIYNMNQSQLDAIDWGQHPMTIIATIISIVVTIWANITYSWRTSKVFGHGVGYFIGLWLLPNIFWLILGFDKSKYDKKALKKKN